jgi:ribonuclease HI
MQLPTNLILLGAKVKAMTQSLAYKIIRQWKMRTDTYQEALDWKATIRNMAYAKGAATDTKGNAPPSSRIWRSVKHKDFPRNIRFFLWMLLHGAYKVGPHWEKIPGYEDWGTCHTCGVTESMTHILTQCTAPGQSQIWDLTSELWQLKTKSDLRPSLGEIMACGIIEKANTGTSRLFRIVVSESAHLIWKLRNERVIGEKGPASTREIHNRWIKSINNRIALDCALTDATKYGKKSIRKSVVRKTWCKVLCDEDRLPDDWTRETGVLVGVG